MSALLGESDLLQTLGSTLSIAAILSWFLLRGTNSTAAPPYEVHANYFGNILGEADMSAFKGEGSGYTWAQTDEEVEISVPLGATTRARDISCQITSSTIALACSGSQILQGRLHRSVNAEDCDWKIENSPEGNARLLTITLIKTEPTRGNQHWTSVLQTASR
ncbi:hypothetical protein AB1Y20_017797 [Prymnesium parvum]|uniref:CS domain-containing protein n=1 Tax=Prymnesium parvum TaxID=97485 RepID=A0AB34JM90_PRYPA